MDRRAFHSELVKAQREFHQIHAEFIALRRMLRERKYEDDQPRAPAGSANGGQWVSAGGTTSRTSGETRVAAAGVLAPAVPLVIGYVERQAIAAGISAGMAALGAILQSRPGAAGAVVEFNATEFERGANNTLVITSRGTLTEEQIRTECPRFSEIQARTEETTARLRRERPDLLPWVFGTAVHVNLKDQIVALNDPTLQAETSIVKSGGASKPGEPAFRIDVLEVTPNNDICIYDIKTGKQGLTLARSLELAGEAYKIADLHNMAPARIFLIEVRPRL